MAAISSGVAAPVLSSITETRYCISDHLLLHGAPSRAAAHPATDTFAPIRHRLPDVFQGHSGTPVVNDPTRRSHRWTHAPAVGAAGGFRSVAPHLDLPTAGLRPLGGELERHVEVEGLDDPEAGEVLLVSNWGGS